MKWIRISALLLLGVGIILQILLGQQKSLRKSEGSSEAVKENKENIEIVKAKKDLVLPDLQISQPKKLYIQIKGGVKKLRFDTTFSNIGKGPLELIGETNEETGKTVATQLIKKTDGSKEEMVIGEFIFHPGHDHWHVDKYAQFQLWKYNELGEPVSLASSTDKFSFCIWDEHTYDLSLENAPSTRQFPRCPKNIQGISVGWGDTYPAYLEGQEINIDSIEDGKYMVLSKVNTESKILESDYSNNTTILYIEIKNNDVIIHDKP